MRWERLPDAIVDVAPVGEAHRLRGFGQALVEQERQVIRQRGRRRRSLWKMTFPQPHHELVKDDSVTAAVKALKREQLLRRRGRGERCEFTREFSAVPQRHEDPETRLKVIEQRSRRDRTARRRVGRCEGSRA